MEEEQEIYRIVAVIQEEIAVILAIVIKDVVVLLVDTLITAIMDKLFIGEVGSLKVQIEEDYHLRLEETGRFKIIRKLQEITTEKDKTVEEIVPRERHTEDDGDDGKDIWVLECKKKKQLICIFLSTTVYVCSIAEIDWL